MQSKETSNEWAGVLGSSEHHTTGARAWCLQDAEWCTPDALCPCCHTSLGHVAVWLPKKNTDEYIDLAVKIHMSINIASDRGAVLEVLDALWEMRE